MKKINLTMILALSLLVLFLFGCKAQEVPAADDSGATPESIRALAGSNNKFAFDLYAELMQEQGNVFISPWSITTALGMTFEGARGDTAKQMADVFYFAQPDAERRASFARIHNLLNEPNKEFKLHIANALWAQKDFAFLQEYTSTVDRYYAGKVTNVDFQSDPEGARQLINTWVEDRTNDKIKDLFPPGTIDSLYRLVLTNAIYFKGTWVKEFDKSKTNDEPFYITPDNDVQVKMMQRTKDAMFKYGEFDNLQVLEMPYKGDKLSMLVLLPKGDISSLESKLTAENFASWRGNLMMQDVKVYMPKFTFETKYFLADTLKQMGMPLAFDSGSADFSGMDGKKDLFIDTVIHQAFVNVNEEGTEAAAATGVGMTLTAMPRETTFRADHPFIFVIQDIETRNILFMGRVTDPR